MQIGQKYICRVHKGECGGLGAEKLGVHRAYKSYTDVLVQKGQGHGGT